jgi:hypothetical protein
MRLISIIPLLTISILFGCGSEPDKQEAKNDEILSEVDQNLISSDSLKVEDMENVNLDKMSPALRRNVISHRNTSDESVIRGLVLLGVDVTDEFIDQISQIGITVNTKSGRFLTISGNATALINLTTFDDVVRMDASQTRDPLQSN